MAQSDAQQYRQSAGEFTTPAAPVAAPEVLVVGAGPVGLTAAFQLLRRGVRVRLIDAKDGPATTSRALGTHARTLEIYDQMGVIDDILPRGQRVYAFTRHPAGAPPEAAIRIPYDFAGLPTRFDYSFFIDQVITEAALRQQVEANGGRIEWGTQLETLQQDGDGVMVTLRHADGAQEQLRVPWVIGCDGAHSTVRKILGVPLEGESTETWLIADAHVVTDLARDSIHWLFPPKGTVMLYPFPEPGKWRLLDTVDVSYEGDSTAVAAQFSEKISAALATPTQVETPSWVSVFTIQQRAIPRMHRGRCFLAGDAAHVHSPASGQGMNTGIHEAYNLAWKLAMVIHGQAGSAILESYDAERVPIGQALLASTRNVTETAMQDDPSMTAQAMQAYSGRLIRSMSGLMLAYPDSPLTQPETGAEHSSGPVGPRPGERLTQVTAADAAHAGWQALFGELRDPRWTLLMLGDQDDTTAQQEVSALAQRHGDWLSVRQIVTQAPEAAGAGDARENTPSPLSDPDGSLARALGLRSGGWLLVRPDGYLAARGARLRLADLRAALGRSAIVV